jgi:hypothetical protein
MFVILCASRPEFSNTVIVFWWLLFLFYFLCVSEDYPRACLFLAFWTASGWSLAPAVLRRPLPGDVHFLSTPFPAKGFPRHVLGSAFRLSVRLPCPLSASWVFASLPSPFVSLRRPLFSYFLNNVLLNYLGKNHPFYPF